MGGMGAGSVHAPGKGGLSFNRILSWLQGELQKSHETGAELHDTLGGSLVSRSAIHLFYISQHWLTLLLCS
jgi:hypothetical protein